MPHKPSSSFSRPVSLFIFGLICHVGVTWSQGVCSFRYPHEPAPSVLWGAIMPVDTDTLPSRGADKRSSDYDGFKFADSGTPLWRDVDPLGGYLVTTMPYGLQIWDVGDGTSPALVRLHDMSGWNGAFVTFPLPGEDDFFWDTGDAHDASPTRSYFAQIGALGLAIWSFNPLAPTVAPVLHYQDEIDTLVKYVDVELIEVGGTVYAYVANSKGPTSSLEIYDVSRAGDLNRCLDPSGSHGSCSGVYQGSFSVGELAIQDMTGVGTYLATSHSFSDGTKIWDAAATPLAPALRVEVGPSDNTKATGLWMSGDGNYGVAVQTVNQLMVYRVSAACLATGACAGAAVAQTYAQSFGTNSTLLSAFSAGGRDLVYAGDVSQCGGTPNKEELLDVTSLSAVAAIMPRTTAVFPEGGPVDYPGWYSPNTGVGFQWYQPHRMTGIGDTIYRAGFTSLDHHTFADIDPTITVSGPAVSFRDQPSQFVATASNCDAGTGTWSWSAGGDASVQLVTAGVADITWTGLGSRTVRAMNTACEPGTVFNDAVTDVQAPEALVVDVLLDGVAMPQPVTRNVCDVMAFTADVAGQLPLTYAWEVRDGQGVVVSPGTADPSLPSFPWDSTDRQMLVPEMLSINLMLSNAVSNVSESRDFELLSLPQLSFGAGEPACADLGDVSCGLQAQSGGATITAYANATGANEYKWEYRAAMTSTFTLFKDFGAGGPIEMIPLTTGEWEIQVSVRNCLEQQASQLLTDGTDRDTVFTVVAVPPVADFAITTLLVCPGNDNCKADIGQTITFSNDSSGDRTNYVVGFTNTDVMASDCTGQAFNDPQLLSFSFTYNTPGVFFSTLR